MSTLKVNTIQDTTGNDALTIDSSGNVTASQGFVPSTQLSNRNIVINGAMQVAQRGTQVTGITSTAYRTCDRIKPSISNLGTWTIDQSTDSPDGFNNSFKVTCTTADASPATADFIMLQYTIEAQDLQRLGYGTSGAKEATLSFYVKSNKTGSASFEVRNQDSAKAFTKSYTVSSADTWERKTITFPADTVNTLNNDTGEGFTMNWWLNGGSTFSGGSYSSGWVDLSNPIRNINNLGVGGATSDYFAITGVQLEVGSVATPFEHRSYGEELARCQRYYYKMGNQGYTSWETHGMVRGETTTQGVIVTPFPVPMRNVPTISFSGTYSTDVRINGNTNQFVTGANQLNAGTSNMYWYANLATSGLSANASYNLEIQGSSYFSFDAEL